MCTKEAPIHDNIKQALVAATERDTDLMFRTMHNTARVFKNAISSEVVAMEKRGAKFEEVRHLVAGARGRTLFERRCARRRRQRRNGHRPDRRRAELRGVDRSHRARLPQSPDAALRWLGSERANQAIGRWRAAFRAPGHGAQSAMQQRAELKACLLAGVTQLSARMPLWLRAQDDRCECGDVGGLSTNRIRTR